VAAREGADLAELADWVEGLRAAAQKAREEGDLTVAEALDMTRFEVYEGYLHEELYQSRRVLGGSWLRPQGSPHMLTKEVFRTAAP
jgi:hypothetical protein